VLKDAVYLISDIILNPIKENGAFKEEFVTQEKETLREVIESKINDKAEYAQDRAVEEMFKDEPYGLYKYGYVEDLDSITPQILYKQYEKIINEAEIHIYVSGNLEVEEVKKLFENNFSALKRNVNSRIEVRNTHASKGQAEVVENQNVTQGKLVLGYNLESNDVKKDFYKMTVYNAILGGTASSKLFNNVREKKSLAYTIRSQYVKHIGTLFVSAGIELDNFDIAKESILKEIDDMKNGIITDIELNDAKVNLITRFKSYNDSQSALIGWSIGQKLLGVTEDIDETIKEVEKITKEDVIDVASRLKLELSYFLTK
jgi:predicted Zn-dependent peptidase